MAGRGLAILILLLTASAPGCLAPDFTGRSTLREPSDANPPIDSTSGAPKTKCKSAIFYPREGRRIHAVICFKGDLMGGSWSRQCGSQWFSSSQGQIGIVEWKYAFAEDGKCTMEIAETKYSMEKGSLFLVSLDPRVIDVEQIPATPDEIQAPVLLRKNEYHPYLELLGERHPEVAKFLKGTEPN